jgi:acyl-CoA reductase-like NAD-dependent aldehyde dehydrogenase
MAREEIFGPVLSVMRVGSFAEALEVSNATAYKLTGGADYLLHFVEPRSCCENTMRHGFAPGLE